VKSKMKAGAAKVVDKAKSLEKDIEREEKRLRMRQKIWSMELKNKLRRSATTDPDP